MNRLNTLGRQRKKLVQAETELRAELEAEIRAAALAGVEQKEIIKATGYSREMVRLASMSEEEREAERAKRRKK